MHRNNLAIETQCSWGIVEKEPTVIDLKEEATEDILIM